jgi:hypothetical protein
LQIENEKKFARLLHWHRRPISLRQGSLRASVISGLAAASPIQVCRVGEFCAGGGTHRLLQRRPL